MLQNPCKTLGFKKNMVYEIPSGGVGKPYPASGLIHVDCDPRFQLPQKLERVQALLCILLPSLNRSCSLMQMPIF